jgi:CrcB protein
MINFIAVGLGGFLGACARYAISRILHPLTTQFPLSTLLSNVLAGLLIGLLVGMERQSFLIPDRVHLFLVVGLLGGLSTFSAFSLETVLLLENANYLKAFLNTALNVGFSLTAVFIGLLLARMLATLTE